VKILAIKFKQLGDVAIMVPALRALREHWPTAELHVLVAEEALPILQHIPWIHRVWGLPRVRGRMQLKRTLPLIAQLRGKCFDKSVDFVGNDRGALISRLIGAKERLGHFQRGGFMGRNYCYTRIARGSDHLVRADIKVLSAWGVQAPSNLRHEVRANPELVSFARSCFPQSDTVLCHLSASMPKREWPNERWAEIAELGRMEGIPILFSAGASEREHASLKKLRELVPWAHFLSAPLSLAQFLAIQSEARVFVGSDSGPLHFATGLGVPSIGLFGPMLPEQVAPLDSRCHPIVGTKCLCDPNARNCDSRRPCLEGISVQQLWIRIRALYRG